MEQGLLPELPTQSRCGDRRLRLGAGVGATVLGAAVAPGVGADGGRLRVGGGVPGGERAQGGEVSRVPGGEPASAGGVPSDGGRAARRRGAGG